MPPGLSEHYLRRGVADNAAAAIASARVDEDRDALCGSSAKEGCVLVGASKFFKPEKIPAWQMKHRQLQVSRESRVQLLEFVRTEAAVAAGVEWRDLHTREWWGELAKYQFLLTPLSAAGTSAKICEALLVMTIPVIQAAWYTTVDDLISMGFPVVKILFWEEVTNANLRKWWFSLWHRLASFRKNCLTTEGYWNLLTGQISVCY
jgi:hypothetical protein